MHNPPRQLFHNSLTVDCRKHITHKRHEKRDQSAAVIGKEAPSTIPKFLHLVSLPCTHSAAQGFVKGRQALTDPITTPYSRPSPIL